MRRGVVATVKPGQGKAKSVRANEREKNGSAAGWEVESGEFLVVDPQLLRWDDAGLQRTAAVQDSRRLDSLASYGVRRCRQSQSRTGGGRDSGSCREGSFCGRAAVAANGNKNKQRELQCGEWEMASTGRRRRGRRRRRQRRRRSVAESRAQHAASSGMEYPSGEGPTVGRRGGKGR